MSFIDKVLKVGVKIISAAQAKEASDNRSEKKQIDQFGWLMKKIEEESKYGHTFFHYRGSPLYPEVIKSLQKLGYTIAYPPKGERFIEVGPRNDMSPIRNTIAWY